MSVYLSTSMCLHVYMSVYKCGLPGLPILVYFLVDRPLKNRYLSFKIIRTTKLSGWGVYSISTRVLEDISSKYATFFTTYVLFTCLYIFISCRLLIVLINHFVYLFWLTAEYMYLSVIPNIDICHLKKYYY